MISFLPQLGFYQAGEIWVKPKSNGVIAIKIDKNNFKLSYAHHINQEVITRSGSGLESLILFMKEIL